MNAEHTYSNIAIKKGTTLNTMELLVLRVVSASDMNVWYIALANVTIPMYVFVSIFLSFVNFCDG